MKINIAVASTHEEAVKALSSTALSIKVNAPRRRQFRKGSGGPEFKLRQRKARMWYQRNKAKVKRDNAMYRKRNKIALKRRADFLKKAPKRAILSR